MDNPATPDVDLDDLDPDDLSEVDEDENVLRGRPEDNWSDGLPEGPAPEDEDWSDVDDGDPGVALVDDTHPTAD